MLSDHDLERALQRYRVVDPPSGFESAIVTATLGAPSRFEWLLGPIAAAAVLAVWVATRIAMTEVPVDPVRANELQYVTEILGGSANAAAYAEFVVPIVPKQDPLIALGEEVWQTN